MEAGRWAKILFNVPGMLEFDQWSHAMGNVIKLVPMKCREANRDELMGSVVLQQRLGAMSAELGPGLNPVCIEGRYIVSEYCSLF